MSLVQQEMKFATSWEVRPYSLVVKCQHVGGGGNLLPPSSG